MADGGEPEPFCSKNRSHKSDCQYFAGGGQADEMQVPVEPPKSVSGMEVPADDLPVNHSSSGQEVPHDDIPDEALSGTEVPANDLPSGPNKYADPLNKSFSHKEAWARGIAGPLATGIELGIGKLTGSPAFSAEAIAGRREANPETALIEGVTTAGSMALGVGEAGLLAKGFSKIGSGIVQRALPYMGIQAGNEVTNWLLGQGDPETPWASAAAHIGGVGILSAVTEGLFTGPKLASSSALKVAEDQRVVNGFNAFLAGIGHRAAEAAGNISKEGIETLETAGAGSKMAFNWGKKAYDAMVKSIPTSTAATVEATRGYEKEGVWGGIKGGLYGGIIGFLGSMGMQKAATIAAPKIIQMLGQDATATVPTVVRWAKTLNDSSQFVTNVVESLFKSGAVQAYDAAHTAKAKEKINKIIEDGGIISNLQNQQHLNNQTQGFAKGGSVDKPEEPNHFAKAFPEQNALLNMSRGRIYNYLNQLRPQKDVPKPAFDQKPSQKEQERSYDQALGIAAEPLSILNHIKKGDLTPDTLAHFNALFPELHMHLGKKITERIVKSQMDEEKPPPYGIRQSMSLFLGTNLDGSLDQPAIAAAQNVFAMKQAAQQPQQNQPKKKGKSSLSKSSQSYLTDSQARIERSQKG